MIHMTIQQLSSYLDAGLAADSMERVGIHLSSCPECTSKFAALERQADRLSDAFGHDPGDLLSEQFEREVEERILSGKRMVAPRPAAARELPPLPEVPPAVPRAPALASAEKSASHVPVLSHAGQGVKRTARAVVTSVQSLATPRRREEDSSPWPVAWAAAIILLVIVSGVGVVVSRTGILPLLWTDLPSLQLASTSAPGPEETPVAASDAPSPGETADWAVVPGGPPQAPPEPSSRETPIVEPSPMPSRVPVPPREPEPSELPAGDDSIESPKAENPAAVVPVPETVPGAPTATLREDELLSPVEAARRSSERAATDPSTSSYEAAARAWESALGSLHGDAYQEGRWRIAEARFRAWQMDPDEGQRASRANSAIRAYLIAAPPGEEREQARSWLNVIRESGFR